LVSAALARVHDGSFAADWTTQYSSPSWARISWVAPAPVSREEILAAVVHLAFYAGPPAAYASLEVVRSAFRELDGDQGERR
jgi:hypothetical protein